jgi:hypothetical protein
MATIIITQGDTRKDRLRISDILMLNFKGLTRFYRSILTSESFKEICINNY